MNSLTPILSPINIGRLPPYIDSTMLVAFRACPRKFFWEYILCLRPRGRKIDLVAGGAFAAGLEAAYVARYSRNLNLTNCLMSAYCAFRHSWGDFPLEDSASPGKTFARTFQAIIDYLHRYPFDTDHVRPMLRHDGTPMFEFSFSVPLTETVIGPTGVEHHFPLHPDTGDPFLYVGRFDSFGTLSDKLVIRDEKTMGRAPDRNWSDKYNLRNQFIGYTWGAQCYGFLVDTVVVRGITIQKTQFQHIEALKIYPPELIEKFLSQLSRDLFRLCDCYTSDYFDYDFGDSCTAFNRPCSFMDLCTAARPEIWFGDYDRERWDPLNRQSIPILLEAAA